MGVNNSLEYLNIGCICRAKSATEAWEYWYNELEEQHKKGFNDSSRDGDVVGEFINAITIISDPRKNIVESDIRKLSKQYMIGEFLWYNSASNKLSDIQNYTNAWDRMSDDGITVNSNYGHKIREFYGFDQWEHVKRLLTKDENSRQAIIHIKDPNPEPSNDVPCTISLQFLIRNGELHLIVNMRSNDIWMGFPYDVFNFCCFQVQMAMELGVKIGCYVHTAGSLHLYERNSKIDPETFKCECGAITCDEPCKCGDESCGCETDEPACKCSHKRPEGLHRSI